MSTIVQELQDVLGVKDTDLRKLAIGANALKDPDWNKLTTPAQKWVNDALEEIEKARTEKRDPKIAAPDATNGSKPAPAKTAAAKATAPKKPAQASKPAAKPAKPKPARKARAGIHSEPGKLMPAREGSKQAALIDALAQPQGATFKELMDAVNDKKFKHLKPWQESTTRASLHWDVHKVKGYGVRTEYLDKAAIEKSGRPKEAKGMKDGDALAVYHLVLPKGVKTPLPHTPRKSAPPAAKKAA